MIENVLSIFPKHIHLGKSMMEEPHHYKVCCGCDGIVGITVALCPVCRSYRFETEERAVLQQAIFIAAEEEPQVIMAEDLV